MSPVGGGAAGRTTTPRDGHGGGRPAGGSLTRGEPRGRLRGAHATLRDMQSRACFCALRAVCKNVFAFVVICNESRGWGAPADLKSPVSSIQVLLTHGLLMALKRASCYGLCTPGAHSKARPSDGRVGISAGGLLSWAGGPGRRPPSFYRWLAPSRACSALHGRLGGG